MSRRIDYLEDPDGPEPTCVVPSANVIVTNDADEILLIRRSDNGNYALPGGGMDLGESMTDTAIRECYEESGYRIEVVVFVGIFTNPGHVVEFTSNGEVRQEFAVVYHGRLAGQARRSGSDEVTEIRWVPRHSATRVAPMHPTMRYRIALLLAGDLPHIDRPGDMTAFLAHEQGGSPAGQW
jgi:8-oxo-dGTP pyrophosphatase MutT (NUDIX family)